VREKTPRDAWKCEVNAMLARKLHAGSCAARRSADFQPAVSLVCILRGAPPRPTRCRLLIGATAGCKPALRLGGAWSPRKVSETSRPGGLWLFPPLTPSLSMNRWWFVVQALACGRACDRLKPGLPTDRGSWSQCAFRTTWSLSMNRRFVVQALACPARPGRLKPALQTDCGTWLPWVILESWRFSLNRSADLLVSFGLGMRSRPTRMSALWFRVRGGKSHSPSSRNITSSDFYPRETHAF
jgi:hypothetical protein